MYVLPAMADEHADAGFFIRDVSLFWLGRRGGLFPVHDGSHCLGGRAASHGHTVRDILGTLVAPCQVHAFPGGADGVGEDGFGLEEPILVHFDAQHPGKLFVGLGGHDGCGEHQEVNGPFLQFPGVGIEVADGDAPVLVLKDRGGTAADVLHAHVLCLVVVLLEVLAVCPQVHVEDGNIGIWVALLDDGGLFGSVHAAYPRAVGETLLFAPGAHALYPGDGLRLLAVRGATGLSFGGSEGREQTFELHGGDDVGILPVTVLLPHLQGLEELEARGHDDAAHLDLDVLGLLKERYGTGLAHPLAGAAADTGIVVNGVYDGHRLRELDVDGLSLRQFLVKRAHHVHRTNSSTIIASRTLVRIDIFALPEDVGCKVPVLAVQACQFGVSEKRYVVVTGDLHHFGGRSADGAVVGREGLVQLHHVPTDGG